MTVYDKLQTIVEMSQYCVDNYNNTEDGEVLDKITSYQLQLPSLIVEIKEELLTVMDGE